MNDTRRRKQLEIMMAIPEEIRIRQLFEMTELSRKIIEGRIRAANPEISPTELKVEVFKAFYRFDFDDQTMHAVLESMREYLNRNA